MRKILRLSLMAGMLLAYLMGCGESGGGLSPSPSTTPSSSSLPLSFPSSAVSAEATIENGIQIRNIVAKDQQSSYSTGNSVANSNNQNMLMFMRKVNDILEETINSSPYSLNAVEKEVKECSNGGSSSTTANVFNNNETVTVTIVFNNCKLDTKESIIFNGTIYTSRQKKENILTINMKYITDFTFSSNSINAKILKNSSMDIVANSETRSIEMKINSIAHQGSKISGQKNAVYYIGNKNSFYQTSGRVYINNLASYVDYDTSYDMSKTPFMIEVLNLKSGEARYNMENGGKVKIVSENNQAKVYIDKDGDGNYELSE